MNLMDVMQKPVATVKADEWLDTAADRMRDRRIHHLVVTRDGKVVGLLSSRDIGPRGRPAARGERATAADAMTAPVVTAAPATTLRQAANLMRGRSVGCLPVTDHGRLVGIVTVSDLLRLLGTGAERPVVRGERWTLRHRGQRPHRPASRP